MPLVPTADDIARIDAAMPMLPAARRARLAELTGLAPTEVGLVVDRGHDDFVVEAIGLGADPKKTLVRVENDLAPDQPVAVAASAFVQLIAMETDGALSATQAKQVLAELVARGGDPSAIAAAKGFEAMASGALEAVVDQIIAAHPKDWAAYLAADDKGRKKLAGFFTGQIMKATQGKADGRAVAEILARHSAG